MAVDPLDELERICSRIKDAIPPDAGWRWELQSRTVLAVISPDLADPLEKLLQDEFHDKWDYLSIETAPDVMYRAFTEDLGIIPGQYVYSREKGDLILFAALWPWGEERLNSFRIGLLSRNDVAYGDWTIRKILRNWFNPGEPDEKSASWVPF